MLWIPLLCSCRGPGGAGGDIPVVPVVPTQAQREAIGRELAPHGEAWTLDELERGYEVTVAETPEGGYRLHLLARGSSGIRSEVTLHPGGRLEGGVTTVPDGPSLSAAQQATVDRALRDAGVAWVVGLRVAGEVGRLDLSQGLTGLAREGSMQTRRRGDDAVIYLRPPDAYVDDPLILTVSLGTQKIAGVQRLKVPKVDPLVWLGPRDVEQLDRALSAQGGLEGHVGTGGWVRIELDGGELRVEEGQRGGESAESFTIDRATGETDNHWVAFGAEPPEPADDPEE